MSDTETIINPINLESAIPLLPLRDVVVFPGMVLPLFVGRERSIKALELAMEGDKNIILASQKDANIEEPEIKDIFEIGVVATIMQLLKLPDGTVKVLVEGEKRVKVDKFIDGDDCFSAEVSAVEAPVSSDSESKAMVKNLLKEFESYGKMSGKIAPEVS